MFIIHGYQAHTNSHWFEWLATQMKSYHYQTEIVYLPNTHNPDLDAWDTAIQNNLKNNLDSDSIIIAHSLGVISILNYLSKEDVFSNIKGLFLISGFNERLHNLPELDQFINQTHVQFKNINAQHIVTIGGDNDPIVDINATNRLSQHLNTTTLELQHDGHFQDSDGYRSFEFLKNQITSILNTKNSEIGI
ncbi:RBBP9/YdeN family alpha/beta hydrolase [Staphylococcus edaphicus]